MFYKFGTKNWLTIFVANKRKKFAEKIKHSYTIEQSNTFNQAAFKANYFKKLVDQHT